ncbi:hypothetical protein PN836_014350 [Ningiella sp. W23]|uniref:hypothetical protein n=1 Tax=Ningiella sp. W23 TaxID=3023715 RepID=UPI003756EE04
MRQQPTTNNHQAPTTNRLDALKTAVSAGVLSILLLMSVVSSNVYANERVTPDFAAETNSGDCPADTECIEVPGYRPDPSFNPCIGGCGGGGGGSGGGGSPGGPVGPPLPPAPEPEDPDPEEERRDCVNAANAQNSLCRSGFANSHARQVSQICSLMPPDITIFGITIEGGRQQCIDTSLANRDAGYESCAANRDLAITRCP